MCGNSATGTVRYITQSPTAPLLSTQVSLTRTTRSSRQPTSLSGCATSCHRQWAVGHVHTQCGMVLPCIVIRPLMVRSPRLSLHTTHNTHKLRAKTKIKTQTHNQVAGGTWCRMAQAPRLVRWASMWHVARGIRPLALAQVRSMRLPSGKPSVAKARELRSIALFYTPTISPTK